MLSSFLKSSVVIALAVGIAGAADARTTLRFHTFYGTEMDEFAKKMQEAVEQGTDGEVRLQYFQGGGLVESDQFVEATARGTIDLAYGVGSYWPGQVDIANIEAGLPGAWVTADEAREVHGKLMPLMEEAYSEAGVVLIGHGYGSNYDLLTKNPVGGIEDLKAMKIRTTGLMADLLSEFGVPTVFLPAQELYVGLSTGVIDGVLYGGPFEYQQLKFDEVAKNYTFLNLLNPGWTETILANPESWEGLTDEQREVVKAAVLQYADDIHNFLEGGNAAVIASGEGFEFASLPEEDTAAMTNAAQRMWDEEAAKSDRAAQAIEILRENAREKGRLE